MSNAVVLRAILHQARENHKGSSFPENLSEITSRKGNTKKFLALKRRDSHLSLSKESGGALHQNVDKWEDLNTFISALESVETWIFSGIVESIWLQVFNLSFYNLLSFQFFFSFLGYNVLLNTFLNSGLMYRALYSYYVQENVIVYIYELIWFHVIPFSRF